MYEQAKQKVENDEQLNAHADFILYDWPEGDDHWQWVVESSVEDILDWVNANA